VAIEWLYAECVLLWAQFIEWLLSGYVGGSLHRGSIEWLCEGYGRLIQRLVLVLSEL